MSADETGWVRAASRGDLAEGELARRRDRGPLDRALRCRRRSLCDRQHLHPRLCPAVGRLARRRADRVPAARRAL